MWGVISRVATQQKLSSILLVSHALEEVEALWYVEHDGAQNITRSSAAGTAARVPLCSMHITPRPLPRLRPCAARVLASWSAAVSAAWGRFST